MWFIILSLRAQRKYAKKVHLAGAFTARDFNVKITRKVKLPADFASRSVRGLSRHP